jgi:hypothetical protein
MSNYPAGSMMGSGIYSVEVTYEVECECGNIWEQDFMTDDWGNVEDDVTCIKCNEKFSFSRERE